MPKKTLFSLLLLTVVFFITSLFYITITGNQLSDTPYYKGQEGNHNDFSSIVENEKWSSGNIIKPEELFKKEKVTENFIARTNNLGIILIPFNTHDKSVDDQIIFRLKNTGEKKWFYQATYDTNQIQTNVPFPFGFPVINQSKNKSYTFEIESLRGRTENSISLSNTYMYFYTKYQFSRTELTHNPFLLLQFLVTKITSQLPYLPIDKIISIIFYTLVPFIVYKFVNFYKNDINKIIFSIRSFLLILLSYKNNKIYKTVKKKVFNYPLDRENKIIICSFIISVGFYCAVAYHYFQGNYYLKKFPISSFIPQSFFYDFYTVYDHWLKVKFNGFGLTYFPGTFLTVDLLTKVFSYNELGAAIAYLTIFVIFIFFFTYKYVKTDNKIESLKNAFIISLMSYPFLFVFQTTNFEITNFIFVSLFFLFYKNRKLSILFLAYATSMKLFPGIFIVLLFLEKRYKDIFLTIVLVGFFTILPLIIYDGGFNKGIDNFVYRTMQNQKDYANLMILSGSGDHYGHSLLNGTRTLFPALIDSTSSYILQYEIFALILFLVIVIYLSLIEKIYWKRVACLVMAMNLLPFTSTDYKLLYILIPLFFFIEYRKKERFDLFHIILFSLLLIPKDYFYFNNSPYSNLNNVANPIIMLSILLLIIIYGIVNVIKEKHLQFSPIWRLENKKEV